MKVSFIQATNPIDVQWNAPLAFGYLKAAAPGHSYSVAKTMMDIRQQKPDVLGISCMSQDFNEAVRISDEAKSIGVPTVVFGGHHITAFPDTLPESADLGVLGEGEWAWKEFTEGREWKDIAGVVFRGRGIIRTSRRELGDIDDLPMPDRQLGRTKKQPPYLFTSRGCPYKCSFCASSVYWDKTRFHSAARVMSEIEDIEQGHINIWDDLFIANKPRLRSLSEQLSASGRSFSTSAKADLVDDEMCRLMTAMNLRRIGIGAESGSDRVLKLLKTPSCSVAANQRALDVMKEHGIAAGAGFVFGHWEETEADVHDTYRWIMRNYGQEKLMNHEVNILTPMPGTPVWKWAEERGYPVRKWDRLRFLSLNVNNLKGMDQWIRLREENKSLYLGRIPQDTLYEMIAHYESLIRRGLFGSGASIGARVKALKKSAKKKLRSLV